MRKRLTRQRVGVWRGPGPPEASAPSNLPRQKFFTKNRESPHVWGNGRPRPQSVCGLSAMRPRPRDARYNSLRNLGTTCPVAAGRVKRTRQASPSCLWRRLSGADPEERQVSIMAHVAERTDLCRQITEAAEQGNLPTGEQLLQLRLALRAARWESLVPPTGELNVLMELGREARRALLAVAALAGVDPERLLQEAGPGESLAWDSLVATVGAKRRAGRARATPKRPAGI